MPYGKVIYRKPPEDMFMCEYPVNDSSGNPVTCGRWCRDLARHITRHHKITCRKYKEMLGLNYSTSLISEQTKGKLREANLKHKTYVNLEKGRKHQFKKGDNVIQTYKRSEESKSTLRTLRT